MWKIPDKQNGVRSVVVRPSLDVSIRGKNNLSNCNKGRIFGKNLMIIISAISIEGFYTEGFTFLISHFLENVDL